MNGVSIQGMYGTYLPKSDVPSVSLRTPSVFCFLKKKTIKHLKNQSINTKHDLRHVTVYPPLFLAFAVAQRLCRVHHFSFCIWRVLLLKRYFLGCCVPNVFFFFFLLLEGASP